VPPLPERGDSTTPSAANARTSGADRSAIMRGLDWKLHPSVPRRSPPDFGQGARSPHTSNSRFSTLHPQTG
jgi:hypothetical protein